MGKIAEPKTITIRELDRLLDGVKNSTAESQEAANEVSDSKMKKLQQEGIASLDVAAARIDGSITSVMKTLRLYEESLPVKQRLEVIAKREEILELLVEELKTYQKRNKVEMFGQFSLEVAIERLNGVKNILKALVGIGLVGSAAIGWWLVTINATQPNEAIVNPNHQLVDDGKLFKPTKPDVSQTRSVSK